MGCRVRTPRNDDDPAEQGQWRERGHLREFNAPSYALHEAQSLRRLHKAFGTQGPKLTQARAEYIRFDASFDSHFLSLKHVVLMRWRFWAGGAALGAEPGRVRRKQHGRVNSALDGPHQGCLGGEGVEPGLHLA